jgi:molybdopterin/thiamine biosynthesis adenylyltransferase
MYSMELHVTTIIPGRTPCLQCIVPEKPATWKRQFPVLGAVSGVAGCLGAVEVVKLLTGVGEPLAGVLLVMNLDTMRIRQLKVAREPNCPVCAAIS